MRKLTAIVGSAVFLVIAPGFVTGWVPWWISRWQFKAPFFGIFAFRVFGAALITLGIAALLDSFTRFALNGLGTPAPVFPTRRLVITGLYRYVRNPMYVAVVITIVGQSLLLGSRALLAYGVLVWVLCHIFVLLYEEPALGTSFGNEYRSYRAEVHRWIPRLTPWKSRSEGDVTRDCSMKRG